MVPVLRSFTLVSLVLMAACSPDKPAVTAPPAAAPVLPASPAQPAAAPIAGNLAG